MNMTFTSLSFLIFMGILCVAYYLPVLRKKQWIVLLTASYFFYIYNSYQYTAFILITTLTIYLAAAKVDKITE